MPERAVDGSIRCSREGRLPSRNTAETSCRPMPAPAHCGARDSGCRAGDSAWSLPRWWADATRRQGVPQSARTVARTTVPVRLAAPRQHEHDHGQPIRPSRRRNADVSVAGSLCRGNRLRLKANRRSGHRRGGVHRPCLERPVQQAHTDQQLDAIPQDLRRGDRRSLPGRIGGRLLPERRRQLLRGPHRRR